MPTTTSKQTSRKINPASSSNGMGKTHDLNAEVETLKAEISSVMQTLSKITDAGIGEVSAKGEKFKSSGLQKSQELTNELKAQVSDIEAKAVTAVRNNPLRTLGLAVGAGFLTALLLRR